MTAAQALTLLYTTVNESTIQGYLGSGKVYKSLHRPDNAVLPCMTIRLLALGRIGQQFALKQYQAIFSLYTDNAGISRQPDFDLENAVEIRLNELLDEKILSSSAGKVELRGRQPVTTIGPDSGGSPPNETIFQFSFEADVY